MKQNTDKLHIQSAMHTMEGDGAEVQRLFPLRSGPMNFDPFVLFDHFSLQPNTGFPTHPHRGFEAITYMFEGGMKHKDNLGNDSTVGIGGAQRFTAGRGIEHSEMPQGKSSGIQLWINLPQSLKGLDPAYQDVAARRIPVRHQGETEIRVIVGEGSPLQLHTPVRYEHICMPAGGCYQTQITTSFVGLIYVIKGKINIADQSIGMAKAAYFTGGMALQISAETQARVMLVIGKPHGEPIRQYGPYVD